MNLVLGIDPGNVRSAAVLYSPIERRILDSLYTDNDNMLSYIDHGDIGNPIVIFEMIACYGMPVGKEVFDTCVWIGRMIEVAKKHNYKTDLIYRRDVKMWLCNSMSAKDGNIRQALLDKVGPVGTKKNQGPCYGLSGDKWAALAVAITWAEKNVAP